MGVGEGPVHLVIGHGGEACCFSLYTASPTAPDKVGVASNARLLTGICYYASCSLQGALRRSAKDAGIATPRAKGVHTIAKGEVTQTGFGEEDQVVIHNCDSSEGDWHKLVLGGNETAAHIP